jgi:DNA-binding CsgD family transcriptional regulator
MEPTGLNMPAALGSASPWMDISEQATLWSFMDKAPVPLLAANDQREILRVNERWSALFGRDASEAETLRIDDLIAPESMAGLELRWTDLLENGLNTARVAIARPDGERLRVRYAAFANVLEGVHVATYLVETGGDARVVRPGRRRAGQLTRREQESLRLVALGMTTTVAAKQLGISPATVRTHVRNAMNKLGARTRAQAIALAMRDGEIPA